MAPRTDSNSAIVERKELSSARLIIASEGEGDEASRLERVHARLCGGHPVDEIWFPCGGGNLNKRVGGDLAVITTARRPILKEGMIGHAGFRLEIHGPSAARDVVIGPVNARSRL